MRDARTWLVAWGATMVGCAGGDGPEAPAAPGFTRACLMVDAIDAPMSDRQGDLSVFTASGTVTATSGFTGPLAISAGASCWPARDGGSFVAFEDGDGTTWRFGWVGFSGAEVQDLPNPFRIGDPVEVVLAVPAAQGEDQALAVMSDGALMLAVEGGRGVRLSDLDDDPLLPLEVTRGAGSGRFATDDCGRIGLELVAFQAGRSEAVLGAWQEGQVEIAGDPFEVRNAGTWSYLSQDPVSVDACDDVDEPLSWLGWRPRGG